DVGTVEVRFDLTGLNLSTDPDDFAILLSEQPGFTNATVISGGSFDGTELVFSGQAFGEAAYLSLATRQCQDPIQYTYIQIESCDPGLLGRDTTYLFTKQGCDSLLVIDYLPLANALSAGPGGLRCNLVSWLQADSGLVFDNGEVSLWQDQSLAGNDASLSISGDRPVLAPDSLNGHAQLYFDGSNDWLKINGLADDLSANASIFAVFIPRDDNDDGYYLSSHNGGSNRLKYGHRVNGELIYDDDSPSLSTAIWHDIPLMVSFRQETAAELVTGWVNGAPANSWTDFSTSSADRVSIGQEYDGSGNDNQTSNHWKGELAELIVFDTLLWVEGRQRVESYLAIKYGLSIPPTSHLYYEHSSHPYQQVGLAQDSSQSLAQYQSRSVLGGSVLSLHAPNPLDEQTFVVLGHNGQSAANSAASTDVPLGMLDRLARIWRVSEQGESGQVELSFDLAGLNWLLPVGSAWALLVDDDGDFGDAKVYPPVIGDSLRFSINLTDGAYISLARGEYREVSAKAILSGAYDANTGLMRDDLREQGLIPLLDPYVGQQSIEAEVLSQSGSEAIVDWVMLELRDATDSTVRAQKAALIRRDGQIVDVDSRTMVLFFANEITGYQASESYFLGVTHRNHLGIMTDSLRAFANGEESVDFSLGIGVWGSHPQKNLSPGTFGLWGGDVNGDGELNFQGAGSDPTQIFVEVLLDPANVSFTRSFVRTAYSNGDVNLDGKVIFQGGGGDVSPLFINVLTHPSNTSFSRSFTVGEQLP
ncbi:MAG: hypothetical protein AAFQ87_19255, partial [Bacteroidota bacterium]